MVVVVDGGGWWQWWWMVMVVVVALTCDRRSHMRLVGALLVMSQTPLQPPESQKIQDAPTSTGKPGFPDFSGIPENTRNIGFGRIFPGRRRLSQIPGKYLSNRLLISFKPVKNLLERFVLVFAKVAGGRENPANTCVPTIFPVCQKNPETYVSGNCGVFRIFLGFWGL